MKKAVKTLSLALILVFVGILGIPQNASAYPVVCPVHSRYHVPNRSTSMSYLVKVKVNGNIYNGTLWTCDCGSQVITTDLGRYCYPSSCQQGHSTGYPYIPGSYSYYIPSSTYSGLPSEWTGIAW